MKSRITFVGHGVNLGTTITLGGIRCNISLRREWDLSKSLDANLIIDISVPGSDGSVTLWAWFSADSIDIKRIDQDDIRPRTRIAEVAELISAQQEEATTEILPQLLKPFKFVEGSVLSGVDATHFFGLIGTQFKLRVVEIGTRHFLIAKHD